MRTRRWTLRGLSLVVCLLAPSMPWPAGAQGRETAGVITEIKVGRGRAEVRAAGGAEWRPAGPLQALRAGDEIRVSGDAVVVVLLSAGRGSVRVDAAKSPLVVGGVAPTDSKLQKARTLVEGSLAFLFASAKEQPRAVLSTRAGVTPPVIVTPRNGPVLPDSLIFEWRGSQLSRYALRIADASGVVLERKGVLGPRFEYPADAPPLRGGARYVFELLAGNYPPQAGLLASRGLIHDARLLVVRALTADPDEPAFHLLLGQLYLKSGLAEQAAEEYDEAQFLLTQGN